LTDRCLSHTYFNGVATDHIVGDELSLT
jgi:hypothetical protein